MIEGIRAKAINRVLSRPKLLYATERRALGHRPSGPNINIDLNQDAKGLQKSRLGYMCVGSWQKSRARDQSTTTLQRFGFFPSTGRSSIKIRSSWIPCKAALFCETAACTGSVLEPQVKGTTAKVYSLMHSPWCQKTRDDACILHSVWEGNRKHNSCPCLMTPL